MANGIGGAAGMGALSGAAQGASIGSLIPGVGTAIGAGIGALAGGISGGVKQQRSNEAQQIPFVDPLERKRLAELEQVRRSISSGTDVQTQQAIQQQQNIGRSAQGALSRVTGGDVGQTMDALLKAQRGTQAGANQAIAQSAQRLPYFDSAVGNLNSRIAQRKLELMRLNRDQRVAEAAQARTDANINANALLGTQGGTQTIAEGVQQAVPQLRDFGTQARQGVQQFFGRIGGLGSGVQRGDFLDTQSIPAPTGGAVTPIQFGSPVANAPETQIPGIGAEGLFGF